MAEIKIEKKSTMWPWVLLAILIIGLLIYFLAFRDDNDDENNRQATMDKTTTEQIAEQPATDTNGTNGEVGAYLQYVDAGRTMGLDHNYTNGALLRLANAIRSKANAVGFDVNADLQKAKEYADKIAQDPFETTHATSIRNAADILANAMSNMQQAKFPNQQGKAQEVRSAANAIDPGKLTLDQKDAVKNFFDQSAQLLQNMN